MNDNKAVCKLICILAMPGSADGLCGSSDPIVLICSGVWGLLSFVGLIAWLRWHGDHSSARDVSTAKLSGLVVKGSRATQQQDATII
jgi:hypothetical protein